jgi:hypothetical protein
VPSQGEDSPVKGRLLLYELDYAHVATGEEQGPNTHRHLPKLKQVQEKVMSGACVNQLMCILGSIGRCLYETDTCVSLYGMPSAWCTRIFLPWCLQ